MTRRPNFYKLLVAGFYLGNIVGLTIFWWLTFGSQMRPTASNLFLGFGRIAGLLTVIFILAELLMMARIKLIEKAYALDELTRIHRINGYLAFTFMFIHFICITIGYQLLSKRSFIGELVNLALSLEDVLQASLGLVLFTIVTVSSIRAAKKRVSYETWYVLHLGAYLAVLLTFGHQIASGANFIANPGFALYWYCLYTVVALLIIWYRVLTPLSSLWRYRLRLVEVKNETKDTYTLRLAGPGLQNFHYEPGQFCEWMILSPKIWWQSHPFSISSNYGDKTLDVTVKAVGDYTKIMNQAKIGSRVLVDGPHGKFTLAKAEKTKLLMIAGGVGITPLFAQLKSLDFSEYQVTLLYACGTTEEVIFREELAALSHKGLAVRNYYDADPHQPQQRVDTTILQQVPDLQQHDVFICGPVPMMNAVTAALIKLNVPAHRIHTERFDY